MKAKRLISLILAALMLCSIMVVAVEAKDTNTLKTGAKRPLIQDVVNSDAKNQVDTNTYLFYFPDSWRNEHNNYYSGTLDTCKPGIYWWDGSYRCDDYKGENTNGFPGYAVDQNVDNNNKNIYKAEVPADVENIMWNNLVEVDPANQETYQYLFQTDNIVSSFYDTEEDIYGFYPEGLSSFDNMIYVVDPQSEKTQGYGTTFFRGEWFYYYGNSEYGIYPTRNEAEANNAVYSNGEFPKYEGEEEGTTPEPTIAEPDSTGFDSETYPEPTVAESEPTGTNPGTEATEQQGGSDTYSVLFANKQKWENVYVYAWESNGAEENAAWPGEKLAVWEITSDDIEIYKATIPKKFDMFVFSDGTAAESTVEIKYNPEVIGYYPKEKNDRGKWEVATDPENVVDPTEPQPTGEVNPNDTKIYFDATGWKNVTKIYCHIWKRGNNAFFNWQSRKEACTYENGKWAYDTENLKNSDSYPEGLKEGEDYCIIFSSNTGRQTYDCTFGLACLGDTLKLSDGVRVENPVDSEKFADEALWVKNANAYGPHLSLTSIGNIIGQFLCPNETGTEVIGDWLPTYYKSQYVKPVEALVNAFPRFGIKTYDDITAIYNYIVAKNTGEDEAEMKRILDEAYGKMPKENPTEPSIPPVVGPTQPFTKPKNRAATTEKKTDNPIKVTVKAKTVKLKKLKKKAQKIKAITVKGAEGKVTFKVVKSGITKKIRKLVKINSSGVITIKKWKKAKKGTYKIKVSVKAAGNSSYNAKTITKTVKVKVK